MESTNNKIELFDHPEYKKLAPKWQKWLDLYEGDHDVLRKPDYLWLHELEADSKGTGIGEEGAKLRALREVLSRYLNLIETIISRYKSFLFRGEMTVPEAVKALLGEDEGMKDIDGKGTSFETFVTDMVGHYFVLMGEGIIVVDTPGVVARTRAEAKAAGLRPYMEAINPLIGRDWSYSDKPDKVGKLSFFRVEYLEEKSRQRATEAPNMQKVSKEYYIDDSGEYAQQRYKADDGKSNEWEKEGGPIEFPSDRIPVSIQKTESFIKDAAEMQLLVFNLMSAESSGLNAQAFQRIFAIGVPEEQKIRFSEWLITFLPDGADVKTIEPPSTATIESAILRCIDWTFKVAFNQISGLAAGSKESPGAETRREIKDDLVALVTTTLTGIEDLINDAIGNYARLKGETPPTERVELDKNVTSDDIENELKIWQAHADDFKKSATLYRAVVKKHAKELNVGNEDAIAKELDEAIKAGTERPAATEGGQEPPANSRTDTLRSLVNGDAGTAANQ